MRHDLGIIAVTCMLRPSRLQVAKQGGGSIQALALLTDKRPHRPPAALERPGGRARARMTALRPMQLELIDAVVAPTALSGAGRREEGESLADALRALAARWLGGIYRAFCSGPL